MKGGGGFVYDINHSSYPASLAVSSANRHSRQYRLLVAISKDQQKRILD